MLEQLARHSLIDIDLEAKGDLHIDMHHTAEDTGIALGQALAKALGERRGIARYGSATVPMDEAMTSVAVDVSGRPHLVWSVAFSSGNDRLHGYRTLPRMVQGGGSQCRADPACAVHYGDNNHHIAESCFKAFARALRQAVAIDPRQQNRIPSTKGILEG